MLADASAAKLCGASVPRGLADPADCERVPRMLAGVGAVGSEQALVCKGLCLRLLLQTRAHGPVRSKFQSPPSVTSVTGNGGKP